MEVAVNWKMLFVAFALACSPNMRSRAQDAAAGGQVTKPAAMAANADPDWEVATVRPSDPNDTRGQHFRPAGRHELMLDTTVEEFLLLGYSVQKSQVAGLPEWAKTQKWDVDGVATLEGQPNWPQLQVLVRKILAERFGLKFHHEQHKLAVYALTVAKGGPKMTLNTSDPSGLLNQQNDGSNGRDVEKLKNTSMQELAEILQWRVGRPVIDRTGLNGRYDFNLQWTTDEAQLTAPNAPPGIFTAIQEQIGLKLQPVKAPADVLVVDKVVRPGAN
jgi:uncharacterized protein (TIGR03435 family)